MSDNKRKQLRGTIFTREEGNPRFIPSIEVRPDDPADLDELIVAAQSVVDQENNLITSFSYEVLRKKLARLRKALQPKEPTND